MSTDKIASLIPEIYYDIISRFSSGIPVIIFVFYETGILSTKFSQLSSSLLFFILLMISYLIGHFLSTISFIVNIILWHRIILRPILNKLQLINPLPSKSAGYAFKELYRRIDLISAKDKTAGAILIKMEAGAALTENLFSGFLIVSALMFFSDTVHDITYPIFCILLLFFLGSIYLRRILLISRQDILYENYKIKNIKEVITT